MVSTLAGLMPYFSRPHCPYLTPTTRVWGATPDHSAHQNTQQACLVTAPHGSYCSPDSPASSHP